MGALIYLDTGEIFECDDDGWPTGDPIVTLQHGILDDDAHALGTQMAAAPESHAANVEAADFIRATFGPTLGDNPEGWSDLDAMRVCRQLEAAIAKATGAA